VTRLSVHFQSSDSCGPLAAYIGPFIKWAREQRYAHDSVQQRERLTRGLNEWLWRRKLGVSAVTPERCAQYLRFRASRHRPYTGDARALTQFREFLVGLKAIPCDPPPVLTPVAQCVQEFSQYLRLERGLASCTIANYCIAIRDLLSQTFPAGPVKVEKLVAKQVIDFVRKRASKFSRKRSKLICCAIRAFLRYACSRGLLQPAILMSVPVVANWTRPLIPRGIEPTQVRRVLDHVDRTTMVGQRDYAILLLLARLGLRASEIVKMELQDIDWRLGILTIRGKGGRLSRLPLPSDVGKALVDYLRSGRPKTHLRRIFLCAEAPIRPLGSPATLCDIVSRALQAASVEAPTTGTHQFRHGLATEMLRQGASLAEIGGLLGHRSPETTTIYAKVDVDALRTLATAWPAEAS
jgi:integrase/recombinase XerD